MSRATFLALLLAAGVAMAQTPAKGPLELAVIVHPGVPARALNKAQLESIFTSARRTWEDGKSVIAFSYSPGSEVRQTFDRAVLGLNPDQVGRFWIDQRIRGNARPPRQVPDPSLVARLVVQMPGSIGFLPVAMVPKEVRIVARVKNGVVTAP